MHKRITALLAAFGAAIIYGLNHTIAKTVMPDYIGAFGLVLLRVVGATVLFWLLSFWFPKETIEKKDYLRIALATLLGMCLNMLMFIKGLSLSTPINSSVIITLLPIMIMILSALFLKEKISSKRISGIFIGFMGALLLILQDADNVINAPNIPLGNAMLFGNVVSYGSYLIIIKPMTQKYSPITLMKWMFLGGIIFSFPVTYSEFFAVKWTSLPFNVIGALAFVVIGTTFLTYLFNIYALKTLSPTTIGVFVYIQPLIGILFAWYTGNDEMSWAKGLATCLVFIGVFLVSQKREKNTT